MQSLKDDATEEKNQAGTKYSHGRVAKKDLQMVFANKHMQTTKRTRSDRVFCEPAVISAANPTPVEVKASDSREIKTG